MGRTALVGCDPSSDSESHGRLISEVDLPAFAEPSIQNGTNMRRPSGVSRVKLVAAAIVIVGGLSACTSVKPTSVVSPATEPVTSTTVFVRTRYVPPPTSYTPPTTIYVPPAPASAGLPNDNTYVNSDIFGS